MHLSKVYWVLQESHWKGKIPDSLTNRWHSYFESPFNINNNEYRNDIMLLLTEAFNEPDNTESKMPCL